MYLKNAVPFSYLGYISRRIFASLIPSNKGNSPFLFGRRVSAEFVLCTLKHSAFSNSCCCFSHPHIQPPTPIRRYSSVSRDHAPVSFLLCALVCETTLLPFKFRNMQLFRKLDARIPLSTISRWIIGFSKINDPEIELPFSVTFFVEYF